MFWQNQPTPESLGSAEANKKKVKRLQKLQKANAVKQRSYSNPRLIDLQDSTAVQFYKSANCAFGYYSSYRRDTVWKFDVVYLEISNKGVRLV